MTTERETPDEAHCAALYALVNRLGGHVVIAGHEMPSQEYLIVRRRTEDDGIEIRISLEGMKQ